MSLFLEQKPENLRLCLSGPPGAASFLGDSLIGMGGPKPSAHLGEGLEVGREMKERKTWSYLQGDGPRLREGTVPLPVEPQSEGGAMGLLRSTSGREAGPTHSL